MSLGRHEVVRDYIRLGPVERPEDEGSGGYIPAAFGRPRDAIILADLDLRASHDHLAELREKQAKRDAMLDKIRAAKTELLERRARVAGMNADGTARDAAADIDEQLRELEDLERGVESGHLRDLPSMASIDKAVTEARLKTAIAELNYAFASGAAMADFTQSMLENMTASHVSQLTSRHFAQMTPDQLRAVSTSLQRHSEQFVGDHNNFMDRMARRGNIGDIQAFSRAKEAERAAALQEARRTGDFREVYGYDIDIAAAGAAAAARVGDEKDQAEAQRRLQEAKDRYVAENMRIAKEEARARGMDAAQTQAHVDAVRDRSRAEADQRVETDKRALGAARDRYIDEAAQRAGDDARARGLSESEIRAAVSRARTTTARELQTPEGAFTNSIEIDTARRENQSLAYGAGLTPTRSIFESPSVTGGQNSISGAVADAPPLIDDEDNQPSASGALRARAQERVTPGPRLPARAELTPRTLTGSAPASVSGGLADTPLLVDDDENQPATSALLQARAQARAVISPSLTTGTIVAERPTIVTDKPVLAAAEQARPQTSVSGGEEAVHENKTPPAKQVVAQNTDKGKSLV